MAPSLIQPTLGACPEALEQREASGDWAGALALAKQILRQAPGDAELWHRLGRLHQRLRQLPQARRAYGRALQLEPVRPTSFNNLCVLELDGLDPDAANHWLEQALALPGLEPQHQALLANTASQLRLFQLRPAEALHFAQQQVLLQPSPVALSNLAVCRRQVGDLDGALASQSLGLKLALEAYPSLLEGLQVDPSCLVDQQLEGLEATVQLHLQLMNLAVLRLGLDPHDLQAQRLLLAGVRTQPEYWRDPRRSATQWQGKPVEELIVWHDQGYGDCLQNLAWLASAASRVGRLRVWLRPSLLPLVQRRLNLPTNCTLEPMQAEAEPWAQGCAQLGLWYLPILLGGWLAQDSRLGSACMKRRLSPADRVQGIGLVWNAGRHPAPQPERAARERDVPFPLLLAAAQRWNRGRDGPLLSLQLPQPQGLDMSQALAQGMLLDAWQAGPHPDWETTAQVVTRLSLVVTVDTAMAHLCGAMGVPCVVVLNAPCDWRWGPSGSRSFLYNSVRLARCPRPGAWREALEQADALVAELLN